MTQNQIVPLEAHQVVDKAAQHEKKVTPGITPYEVGKRFLSYFYAESAS